MAQSICVLHVEDDPDFRDIVSTYLCREDHRIEVEPASDPSEGRSILAERDIDCVVSDFDMPGENGIEFLETVRETYPDLPFILYTGKGSEEVASDAISAGVTDYLQKVTGTSQYEVLANRIANVVEQHRASAQATESRRRLHTIAENTTEVLWHFTADWDELLFVNSAYEEIWGRSIAELEAEPRSFLEDVHPKDRPGVREAMDQLSAGESIDIEYRVNADEDYGRWVWVQGEPVFDDAGDVERVVGFARDVTARKERERELERSQQRYETVFTRTDDAIAWIEFEGERPVVREANPTFERIFAPGNTEITGADLDELVAPVDHIEEARETTSRVKRGELLEEEITRETADGPRDFWLRAVPIEDPETGDVESGYAIYTDISERKKREQQRAATIESLRKLIDVAVDIDLDVHEKISRLLKVGPEQFDLPYGHLTRIEFADDDRESGTQTIIEATGDHELLQPGDSAPLSLSYCQTTIRSEGILEIQDARAADLVSEPAYETFGLGCYIGTKITVDDELYGTLFFASASPREEPFTDAERTVVKLMGELVSYELHQSRE